MRSALRRGMPFYLPCVWRPLPCTSCAPFRLSLFPFTRAAPLSALLWPLCISPSLRTPQHLLRAAHCGRRLLEGRKGEMVSGHNNVVNVILSWACGTNASAGISSSGVSFWDAGCGADDFKGYYCGLTAPFTALVHTVGLAAAMRLLLRGSGGMG